MAKSPGDFTIVFMCHSSLIPLDSSSTYMIFVAHSPYSSGAPTCRCLTWLVGNTGTSAGEACEPGHETSRLGLDEIRVGLGNRSS
ncbi:hypothetical protein BHE74_00035602 [Ensete ventricosum]|nr:hypothetical protein GW17_00048829 [Ensete ventricosum]RWW57584.1 hypothetical protein BHE74_00035602 [Ensete ventricosum]RZR84637.1 hypothetical protein BHM03_00011492 [Ensete ventricosum]